jgi:chromosome segregation ATPase
MEVRESRGAPRRVNGKFDDKLGLKVALEYMDPRSNLAGQTPPVSVLRGNLMSGLDRYRTSQDSKFSEELDGLDREFTNYERSHAKAVQVVSNQQQLKTVLLGRFQMLSERMTEVQNQQNEIQSLREAIETKAQEFQREVEGLKSSNASDVYQLERRLASKAQEIEELSISYLARLDGQDADMDQLRAQIQRLEGEIFNKDAQLQESARQLQIQMGNLQQQVVQSRRSNFLGFGLGFALGFALGKTVSGAQSPGL